MLELVEACRSGRVVLSRQITQDGLGLMLKMESGARMFCRLPGADMLALAIVSACWAGGLEGRAAEAQPGTGIHSTTSAPVTSAPATTSAPARRVVFGVRDNFHAIEAGRAYRSGQLSPETLRATIERYGIRTVVNLRGANPNADWYEQERAACAAAGVKMVDVRLHANAMPERDDLLLLFDTFKSADGPLLMHCAGGADRTGSGAAIWRMTVRGEPAAAAARELSIRYGHIRAVNPEADRLVEIFRPERGWIEREYWAAARGVAATTQTGTTGPAEE